MLDQTLLKLVKHDNAYSWICYLYEKYRMHFFTVESTAQTACDWYEGSMVIPSYFLYVQLLWKQGVHVTVRCA